jgi:hypothetical protein
MLLLATNCHKGLSSSFQMRRAYVRKYVEGFCRVRIRFKFFLTQNKKNTSFYVDYCQTRILYR